MQSKFFNNYEISSLNPLVRVLQRYSVILQLSKIDNVPKVSHGYQAGIRMTLNERSDVEITGRVTFVIPDLGHGRSREVSQCHACVLQGRSRYLRCCGTSQTSKCYFPVSLYCAYYCFTRLRICCLAVVDPKYFRGGCVATEMVYFPSQRREGVLGCICNILHPNVGSPKMAKSYVLIVSTFSTPVTPLDPPLFVVVYICIQKQYLLQYT